MKILKLNESFMEIIKNLEYHMRINKNLGNPTIPCENNENNENHRIQSKTNENHENLRIP